MALYAFDGTWKEGKTGEDPQFENTNVFRFFEAYHKRSGSNDCYMPGIGTRFDVLGKIAGGAFGLGELRRLHDAYDQLCKNWVNGDTVIDVVGFSRGAATTLDFCHLVQEKGIRRPGGDDVVEATPQIRFLGVWDIVAAFGFRKPRQRGAEHRPPPAVAEGEPELCCFHAMALDERRPSFLNTRLPGACEVWFRGVHSDVGGGNGNRALNDVALNWMMRKAKSAGLPIDDADIPHGEPTKLEPSHSHKLPVEVRLISAVDRCHYTVAPLEGWATPPDTCPKETEADEQKAGELSEAGLIVQSEDMRRRVLAMWETAMAVAAANEFTLDPIREALSHAF